MNVAGPFDDLGAHIQASKESMQRGLDALSDGDVRGGVHGLIDGATAMAMTPIDTTLHAIEDLFTDEEEGFLASPQALAIDAKSGPRAGGVWWTLLNNKGTAPLLTKLGKASASPFARVPLVVAALVPYLKAVMVGHLRRAKSDGWPAVGFKNGDDYRSELEATQLAMLVAAATGRVVGCPPTRGNACLAPGEKYSWGYATPERERARALWYLLFSGSSEDEALPHFPDTLLGRTLAGAQQDAKQAPPPPPPPPPGKKRIKLHFPKPRDRRAIHVPRAELHELRAALEKAQASPALAKHARELHGLALDASSPSAGMGYLVVFGILLLARR